MKTSSWTWQQFAVVGLIVFAFGMSALISRTVFERLPHLEDEVAYLFQAQVFARGQVVMDSPTPRQAFFYVFVVDHMGTRFSKYTPGASAFLAVGVILGQVWWANSALAALCVALTYRLGALTFSRKVGLIAAALVAFSPMALLLNATLMSHTAALFCTLLFLVGYAYIERHEHLRALVYTRTSRAWRWALVGGLALGALVALRPLTAVGIALPLVLWSAGKVVIRFFAGGDIRQSLRHVGHFLIPYVILSLAVIPLAATIPLYNLAAVGDPSANLYTLVWEYDRVGFGEGYGRNNHSIERALKNTRFDMPMYAADLFGWQLGAVTPSVQNYLRVANSYYPVFGISWILLPFGLWLGRRNRWAWIALAVATSLVVVHFLYWIGAQVYSTRYYYESLACLAILTAIPIATLIERAGRFVSKDHAAANVARGIGWTLLLFVLLQHAAH
jgi:4-amino-4-deoxy-L-arabinose transferase-like glycosyltransferase